MIVSISKSEVSGRVRAPSSKSYTIRALMCAALARGQSEIIAPLESDDTEAASRVLGKIGVSIEQSGGPWRVSGGNFHKPDEDLFCGDSAATLRFMTAVSAIVPGQCRLTAGPSLSKRPVKPLIEALKKLGVGCSSQNGLPPVTVEGGQFKGGETSLPGDISSQFVSALLLIAPFAEKGMTIKLTTPLESKPYLSMTLDCMSKFGICVGFSEALDWFQAMKQEYQPCRYEVEGDWTSASYFLALGALSRGVRVENLNPSRSLQGDKVMLDFLRQMGANVDVTDNIVTVSRSILKPIKADLTDCIDLLPTMTVLAAVAGGQSELTGIARARLKESNRVKAVSEGLQRLGIKVKEAQDSLVITGGKPQSAVIDSYGDHRIAMAFSVLGVAFGGVTIEKAECVAKTFPQFWAILESIGGRLKIDGQ
ncbi:MAG: 3-phosphoshikimate 1-carboxyvinyltransferase [Dehalococcoidales bacterium]|nr:3-phosphoshikimate 1-carboxyvinyltransferase [Dehalococcoidales bacterium]